MVLTRAGPPKKNKEKKMCPFDCLFTARRTPRICLFDSLFPTTPAESIPMIPICSRPRITGHRPRSMSDSEALELECAPRAEVQDKPRSLSTPRRRPSSLFLNTVPCKENEPASVVVGGGTKDPLVTLRLERSRGDQVFFDFVRLDDEVADGKGFGARRPSRSQSTCTGGEREGLLQVSTPFGL